MSADNYMQVREIGGKWHVWMVLGGYEEEQWTTPDGYYHKEFVDKADAFDYAFQVCKEEVVEYGVVQHDPKKKEEGKQRHSTGWVCPICGSVYAIWVAKCSLCGPKTTTSDTSDWRLP